MVLDQQMLHLNLGDRPPPNFAMVVTPPAESDLGAPDDKDPGPLTPNISSATAKSAVAVAATAPNDPMARIYRHTPTPTIILDDSLRAVEASESHLALFKHRREQLLGISIYELIPGMFPAPEIAFLSGALGAAITLRTAQVLNSVRIREQHDTAFALRVTPIFEDHTLIYVLLEMFPMKAEQSESNMSEQTYLNQTYKILVDTVKDYAIFMLDTRGHIATWNSGAAILKGYTTDDIVGQHFSVFYGLEDRQANKPARELEVCLREGRVEDEGWRYRKDGGRFWANVMITPIYQFGRHVGFVKVTRDLTERKAAEARLIDAFEESSKLKTDFLANMSHELRTPMNGMFLALTLLMRTPLTDDQREYASILEDSTSILLQVINDVLDYSKLSSGSFSLNSDVLNIPSVINAVIRNCQPSLKPGVVLECSLAPDFPVNVKGDPLRFRQVLQNLVGNAVKFTESGYIRVNASYIVSEQDPQSYDISLQVVDSGIGVPDDAVSTLFTPFTRFADSETKRYQGTGLGLSICKSLVELMNGSIGFHTAPNTSGSVFWLEVKMGRIDLPVSRPKRTANNSSKKDSDTSSLLREVAATKQIMLVEDNKVNQTIMLKLLATLGFERVDAAWDGAEAVRMVKQKPLAYHLILMDINMPVMDGLVATEKIREMKMDVPIIALTGNALKGDAETYLAKGMNDYIAKPLHRQQLVDLLWKWCGT
ncbi:Two-component system protein A [Penicillium macrosclerotiorum]|uniref:Two-component system protein A n=1 Tax=Penicillium macrosclerotiorum TaxID=303699 RepID=UPI0025485FCD|nr:Two-component system protein A [Penicillium macrosclerotiorum]KAJ5666608.1 Two-component system protein A [Penicillium macrosclerotiorum]